MPLFDPLNIRSVERESAKQLADRLSECPAFWALSEAEGVDDTAKTADALAKVGVGHIYEPIDGDKFQMVELANEHFFARIGPWPDESGITTEPETLTECPDIGGVFEIYLRRQTRNAEIEAPGGRNDVFNFFWDCAAAIQSQLFEKTHESTTTTPKLNTISRVGPVMANIGEVVAQGEYIWALLRVDWGRPGGS